MSGHEMGVALLYLLGSLTVALLFRIYAYHFSGPKFRPAWLWIYLLLSVAWGASQLSVSTYGHTIFQTTAIESLQNNEAVKWIAFLSIFVHTWFTPEKEKPNSIFSRPGARR